MTPQIVLHRDHRLLACLAIVFITASAVAQETNVIRARRQSAAADFYRIENVQTIHLRIAPEDRQRMLAALPERIYVKASFQWRDVTLNNVAAGTVARAERQPTPVRRWRSDPDR